MHCVKVCPCHVSHVPDKILLVSDLQHLIHYVSHASLTILVDIFKDDKQGCIQRKGTFNKNKNY